MNYSIFIPVRLESKRLAQKHMKKIKDKPIIKYLVERLQQSKKVDQLIICTTKKTSDDPLVKYLEEQKIKFFRGDESDILVRFLDAAKKYETDFIVIVDGDDIYTDPIYVDKIIEEFERSNADFVESKGFPHGFVPVGVKKNSLEKICRLKVSSNTETGYREFFTQTNLFNCKSIQPQKDLDFPKNLRLTLDYEEDFLLSKEVFSQIGNYFHIEDVINLFKKNPKLINIIDGLDERWEKHFKNNLTDLSLKRTEGD